MAASISATLIPCLKLFNQIQEVIVQLPYKFERDVPSTSWTDEMGRLRVWAANVGAHQTGQSSLEFRLRDASHIQQQILSLLTELDEVLKDVKSELSSDPNAVPLATTPTIAEDTWHDEEESESEFQQLYGEVVNVIDCLYKMSMIVRKPAQHDLLLGSYHDDAAAFETYDRSHVREKFPTAEEVIICRLGRAITRRRRYLKYTERHHAKLGKGLEEVQGIPENATQCELSETIATDFQHQAIDVNETSSDSGFSQTSYAPSLVDGGPITLPRPPKESEAGKPFECPYCFFLIDIGGTKSWTRHVFTDMKPYVCVFTECNMADRLYESRRSWFSHMMTEHPEKGLICPLCKETLASSKMFERHIARHLEELALFALPQSEIDAESDGEELDAIKSTSGAVEDLGSTGSEETDDSAVGRVHAKCSNMRDSDASDVGPISMSRTPAPRDLETSPRPPPPPLDTTEDDEKFARLEKLYYEQKALREGKEGVLEQASRKEAAAKRDIEKPIKFKDAIGRRFSFPFDLCKDWRGMEYLIKEAFVLVDVYGVRVANDEYILVGPHDEIITKHVWEVVVQPGWKIRMYMWPDTESPPPETQCMGR